MAHCPEGTARTKKEPGPQGEDMSKPSYAPLLATHLLHVALAPRQEE